MQSTLDYPIKKTVCGNTNTGLLKLIALIFMVIDHVGAAFFPGILELRIIGRMAFPIYVWCCVVGVEYTRNIWKYTLRMLLFSFISQPFYMLGLNHQLYELNVMFTLFFGVCALIGIRKKSFYSHIWAPILAILCGCIFKIDYGWRGILLIITMYSARKSKGTLLVAFFLFCLYWGSESTSVYSIFGIALPNTIPLLSYGGTLLRSLKKLQFMAYYAVVFILWTNKENRRTRLPKWLGYAAYPGHLAIIALLRHLLGT